MPAKILNGEKLANKTLHALSARVKKLKSKGITPGLAAVLVGNDPASELYVNKKTSACKTAGVYSRTVRLHASTTEKKLIAKIRALNNDKKINGILVQLPLPKKINVQRVMEAINPEKDVDGFNPASLGKLFSGDKNCFAPATPLGVMKLLHSANVKLKGRNVVVVGASNIVGKPLGIMLLNEFATVTFCHIHTKNLKAHTINADILISAVGKPKLIRAGMVKKGAVVIDVGTTKTARGLEGDVDFAAVRKKARAITPVPGGVGPMTVASVVENTVKAAELSAGAGRERRKRGR